MPTQAGPMSMRQAARAWRDPRNPLGPQSKKMQPVTAIKDQLGEDARLGVEFLRGAFSSLKRVFSRRPAEPQDADAKSFQEILRRWGIDEENFQQVVRGLQVQRCSLLVVAGLAATAVFSGRLSLWGCLPGAVVAASSFFGIAVLSWRLSVLKEGRFVSFRNWIMRRTHPREEA